MGCYLCGERVGNPHKMNCIFRIVKDVLRECDGRPDTTENEFIVSYGDCDRPNNGDESSGIYYDLPFTD
jgi:hypothetical protein